MLTINPFYSGEGLSRYFEVVNEPSNKAVPTQHGEYYLSEDGQKVVYLGGAAKRLNVYGEEVSKESFTAFGNNRSSKTNERITSRYNEKRKAAWDFTFSAPKSLSIALGVNKNIDIRDYHEEAVLETAQAIEKDLLVQRNDIHGRGYAKADEALYCIFTHLKSRATEQQVNGKKILLEDCQLHSHSVFFNMVYSKEREGFFALENHHVKSQATFYETLYHSILSKKLVDNGYSIRHTKDRYELQIAPSTIRKFSNRTNEIEAISKAKGLTGKKKAELGVKTRVSKSKATKLSDDQLHKIWLDRLSEKERRDLAQLKSPKHKNPKSITPKQAVQKALDHWSERHSAFQYKRVMATALSYGFGQLELKDVEKEIRNNRSDILYSDVGTISYITTKELVKNENKMLDTAVQGKSTVPALHPNYQIKQDHLNKDQQLAVQTLLKSNDFITLIQGFAGTGKTSLITELKYATQEKQKRLLATAISSQATKELSKHDFDASTVAALLHDKKLQESLKQGVLLVDEGSLLSTKDVNRLCDVAKSQNARIFIAGDVMQHQAVEAGSAFRQLQTVSKCKTAHVKTILRQKPEDLKLAVRLLASNRTLEGYQLLNQKLKAVKEVPDHQDRIDQLAESYIVSRLKNRSSLIISPTNAEGSYINDVVRKKLRDKGVIKGKEHKVNSLRSLNLTSAEKQRSVSYEEGMVLKFVKHKPSFKAGDHFEVQPIKNQHDIRLKNIKTGEVRNLPFEHADHFQVFNNTEEDLAIGDEVRITANIRTNKGTRILNGAQHRITSITKNSIKLSNGKTIDRDIGHIRPAYSQTSFSAQSKSVQDCFISMSDLSFAASSREQLYVSVSRAIHNVQIFTSSKEDLKRAIQKGGHEISAVQIAKNPRNKQTLRHQRNHRTSLLEKVQEIRRENQKNTPTFQPVLSSQYQQNQKSYERK